MTDYLNPDESKQLAEEGISRSFANANEVNKAVARNVIRQCAEVMPYFTSEDIWERLEQRADHTINPKQGSFLGHLLREAAKIGIIRLADGRVRQSARPANHLRILRVWQSQLCSTTECCRLCGGPV